MNMNDRAQDDPDAPNNQARHDAQLPYLREHAKRELRARMRSVRGVLPQSARDERSAAAIARALQLPELSAARTIVGFCAIQKEVDPAALLEQLRAQGKRTGLPRVVGEQLQLHAYADASELVPGSFAVNEPPETAPRIDPADVDVVLVPGLAFDERGHRLGYGRAFYDRLLPSMPRAFRVGIAYDFQLVMELPNDAHDIPMHCLISDKRCLRFG
jgi:5-formyltetrahydrofolate cyclo-ligase